MNSFFSSLPMLMGIGGSGAGGASGSGTGQLVTTIITFGLVFVIFYFLIIRPQNRKQKETKRMLQALKKGDRVATAGGIRGSIASIKEDVVVLKVDGNTKIEFNRSAISTVLQQKAVSSKAKASDVDDDDDSTDEEPASEVANETKE